MKSTEEPLPHHQQVPVVGVLDAGQYLSESVKEAIGDKEANGKKGDELHQGFKGNGENKSAVPFRRIQSTRSEDDGEDPQNKRDHPSGCMGSVFFAGQDGEGVEYGLHLKTQVRGYSYQRHDRYKG